MTHLHIVRFNFYSFTKLYVDIIYIMYACGTKNDKRMEI